VRGPVSIRRFVIAVGAPTLTLVGATLAVVVLAAVLIVQASAAGRMERRADAISTHAEEVLTSGLLVLYGATYAQSSLRGYLLTGQAEYLSTYPEAVAEAERGLSGLTRAAAADPDYARQLPAIRSLAQARLGIMDQTVRLARAGRRDEALALLPQGRAMQSALRGHVDALATTARARAAGARSERRAFDRRAAVMQAGLAAATVLALLIALTTLALERRTASRAAAAQKRLNDEIIESGQRAEEADKAKSRFLAAASHDLRQPLHALSLYIATLDRRVESDQAREILSKMDGAVRSMGRLFTALLDLARLEAGILKPTPIAFDIDDLLRDVAEQSVDPSGRRARVDVAESGLLVHSDPDLLEIVLRNLVSNAVKHSRGGRVLLGCRRAGQEVRIEIHDNGQGIAEDQLERLFSEFVRGEQAGSTEGVGLGLAIVERIAKLLGHRLSVRSQLGRGSVFGITVPRTRLPAEPELAPQSTTNIAGLRILVADDEPLALDAMRRTLEDAGAEIVAVDSAAEVRARSAEPFDLYVFDLNLGQENGLQLLAELEAAGGGRIPSLIVTGATSRETLAELKAAGRAWVTKPVTVAAFTAAASRALA